MTYRVYFGGGDRAWIIQALDPEWRTVAAVEEIIVHVPCGMPPYAPGPKPNGFVLVEGDLEIVGGIAHFSAR